MVTLMPMDPLISVLIPVFNRRELVVEAIESALSQEHSSFEVVVSDNCSDDGTWEECVNSYGSDPRVVLVRNPENLGPVPNWLAAAKAARGKYLKILFSDDLMLSGCLEKMISLMHENVGFVYSACLIGESIETARAAYAWSRVGGGAVSRMNSAYGLFLYALRAASCMPASPGAALFRTIDVIRSLEASLEAPACPECLSTGAGPDIKIFLDSLRLYGTFVHVRQPLVFFRSHISSFSVGRQRPSVLIGYDATFRSFFKGMPLVYRVIYLSRNCALSVRRKFRRWLAG